LHYLIMGLLRDRQYEVALDRLEQMQQEGKTIYSWLYDIIIYVLCEAEEPGEAIRILKYREGHGELDISTNLWYFVLDACSSSYHYEGTQYVWQKSVEPDYINPPDGMCLNVLNTAARYGDPSLAADVIRVLSSRGAKLDHSHYEALLASYIGSNDLKSAFLVLCIMKKGGLEPTSSTTRPLYTHFFHRRNRVSDALDIFKTLKKEGHEIPVAAMNVIIEFAAARSQMVEAFDHYKILHKICASGPDIATFNILFQGCARNGGNKELAMFLAAEMAALHVRPNKVTYDWLILVCVDESQHNYEDAFQYFEEMRKAFKLETPRLQTWHALLKRCAQEHDQRYFDVLTEMKALGQDTTELLSRPDVQWNRDPTRQLAGHS